MAGNGHQYLSSRLGFVAFIVCVGVIVLANWSWVDLHPVRAFLMTLAAIIASLAVIGISISGRPDGVIIDNRNRVSLSKFQATAWTVLVVTGLIVVAAHNLSISDVQPLDLNIPTELLAAMGVSATSLVATPLLLSLKTDETPTQQDIDQLKADLQLTSADLQNDGKVFGRQSAKDASWGDMLRGEEVGNAASPDLSKIQQLFISLLLYGIYGVAIVDMLLKQSNRIEGLPALSDKFVWLLALSHASYLAYKAAPHTSDGSSDDKGAAAPAAPVG